MDHGLLVEHLTEAVSHDVSVQQHGQPEAGFRVLGTRGRVEDDLAVDELGLLALVHLFQELLPAGFLAGQPVADLFKEDRWLRGIQHFSQRRGVHGRQPSRRPPWGQDGETAPGVSFARRGECPYMNPFASCKPPPQP